MSRPFETALVKFARFVETRSPDECWPWRGHISKRGYGRVMFEGKVRQAHRVAWQAHNGAEPPTNLVIMHTCDNRQCCNPAHLEPGTQLENMKDCTSKGRRRHPPTGIGEANSQAKLKDAEVIRIREIADMSTRAIARLFGISQQHVSAIRTGRKRQKSGAPQ